MSFINDPDFIYEKKYNSIFNERKRFYSYAKTIKIKSKDISLEQFTKTFFRRFLNLKLQFEELEKGITNNKTQFKTIAINKNELIFYKREQHGAQLRLTIKGREKNKAMVFQVIVEYLLEEAINTLPTHLKLTFIKGQLRKYLLKYQKEKNKNFSK